MCFSFREISLRSVSRCSLCVWKALHFGAERSSWVHLNVTEALNPRVQFVADITSACSLIVAVFTSVLLAIVHSCED